MGFNRLKVRTRIYLGFAALVALGVGIAIFGVVRLSGVDLNVGKMNALAGNIHRVLTVTRQLEAMRRAETRYLFEAPEDAMKDARTNANAADKLLIDTAAATLSEERRKEYNAVRDTLRAHLANLDKFAALSTTWTSERAKLFTGGDTLTANANHLVDAARATHNQAMSDAAAGVEAAVLLVRVANWRFLATLDKAGPATFKTNAERAHAAITTLQEVASPEVASLIAPVQASLAAYEASFAGYSTARLTSSSLYDDQTRPEIMAMQRQLDDAATSLSRAFEDSRTVAVDTISGASFWQEILAVAALVIGTGMALVIGGGIVRPLAAMTGVMVKLAAGDKSVDIPARDNTDEIGDMARAVEVFKEQAVEAERLAAEQDAARAAKERRQSAMEQHTQDFGSSISGVMASLAGSADEMRRAAEAMAESATSVHTEATGTAGAAAKSSRDLMAVAAAVEQLTSSVAEISRQLASASEVAQQAVRRADSSHATMQGLSEATARIGDVVRLISDIASQTNLLALNATIEAARAGEAGKGFAVVAGEVKVLAAQTAKATAEIGSQIDTVRSATSDAVTAMAEIGGIIGKINEVSSAIAAAVEQQNATTHEIAASVQAVSGATAGTASAMEHVVMVADKAGSASQDVLGGAAEIGREAETLRAEVDQFLRAVRDESADERRRYERISANGAMVGVRTKGRSPARMELRNIARGGAALVCDWTLPAGTMLDIELSEAVGGIPARVVRSGGGELALIFNSEPQSLRRLDQYFAGLKKVAA
ncbi:MAG TPA: methyl-accepting chemotaxis protein [Acetobacteraceae bacterium]|nr:methyl-accepting chemotaxis protein [Acetobacteraceae bacterium]